MHDSLDFPPPSIHISAVDVLVGPDILEDLGRMTQDLATADEVDGLDRPVSDEPDFAPIEGVTLEEYVSLCDELARRSLIGQKSIDDWLLTQGVHPGTWGRITSGWSVRMARFPAVRRRYSACMRARRAATVRAILPALD